CNAIFIIGQRIQRIQRPSGMNEDNLFLITQLWVGAPTGDDQASIDKLDSLLRTDVAALHNVPDVESVTTMNTIPLLGSSWTNGVSLQPKQPHSTAHAAFFFGDEDMMRTMGVQLVAGRAFTAADVEHRGFRAKDKPPIIIVTQALADKLFPKGNAVGKTVYLSDNTEPSTIVGVVKRLEVSSADNWTNDFTWYSVMEPVRLNANFSRYLVRAKPGRLQAALKATREALFSANPMRVIDDSAEHNSIRTFSDIRAKAYRADRGMAILMTVICVILLAVTGAGIVGLTSFWVGQRHKQIGVRRALGARKIDILRYFQTENLLIAGGGAIAGIILAVGLNLWLMQRYEMDRMPVLYVLAGVAVVLALGQAAVLAPARRAANVPPVVATRTV
ncbi:MAG: ABC transporter permease, partial [Rhodanobacteraceae bacterium]